MNIPPQLKASAKFGLTTGIVTALLITALFTTLDWARNFGGIFQNESGTNWTIVYETALSWFAPSLLLISLIATIGHLVFKGLIQNKGNTPQ
jgi:hypothetical protein